MSWKFPVCTTLLASFLAGCSDSATPPAPAPVAGASADQPKQAKPAKEATKASADN
jgi:hypothetical protein